jgi:hypothetical protein
MLDVGVVKKLPRSLVMVNDMLHHVFLGLLFYWGGQGNDPIKPLDWVNIS